MPASADIALSLFWGVITLGRMATVLLSFRVPARYLYCSLPPIIFIGLIFIVGGIILFPFLAIIIVTTIFDGM